MDKLLHIKRFQNLFEGLEQNQLDNEPDPQEVQNLETSTDLMKLGLLSSDHVLNLKKAFISKYKKKMLAKFVKGGDPKTPIDYSEWLSSPYGKILSTELISAMETPEFKSLTNKGFRLEPASLQVILNGNIALVIPGIKAKMIITSGGELKRFNYKGGNNTIKYMNHPEPYKEGFRIIDSTIDPTDYNFATIQGAKNKRRRAPEYDQLEREAKATLHQFFGDQFTDIIWNKLIIANQRLSRISYIELYPNEVKLEMSRISDHAAKGIVFLGINSYDKFFTPEIEEFFVSKKLRWVPGSHLSFGRIVFTEDNVHEATPGLTYEALTYMHNTRDNMSVNMDIDTKAGRKFYNILKADPNIMAYPHPYSKYKDIWPGWRPRFF